MNLKPQPNHALYIQTLRQMTPEQRLLKAFELSAMVKELFLLGLKKNFRKKMKKKLKSYFWNESLYGTTGIIK